MGGANPSPREGGKGIGAVQHSKPPSHKGLVGLGIGYLFMLDRKIGLNWSLRGRQKLKIWHPGYFFIPDRLVGSAGLRALENIKKSSF